MEVKLPKKRTFNGYGLSTYRYKNGRVSKYPLPKNDKRLSEIFNEVGFKKFIEIKPYGWSLFLKSRCMCPVCGKQLESVPGDNINGRCNECNRKTEGYKYWRKQVKQQYDSMVKNHLCISCGRKLKDGYHNRKCSDCIAQSFYWSVSENFVKEGISFPRVIGEGVRRYMNGFGIDMDKYSIADRTVEYIIKEGKQNLRVVTSNGICYNLRKYTRTDKNNNSTVRYEVSYYGRI